LAPQACSTCHHSALSDIADQTLSAKVALHRSCWKCHEAQTGEKATAHCSFCHNRNRIAGPAVGAAK
jgi:DnaJ-class molecular chaperone